MAITGTYDDLIEEAANTYRVPFAWVKAVIGTESGFDPKAYRAEPAISDASYGLMQILYSTARSLGYSGTPEGLFDPRTNIMLGTKYIAQLIERWGMDFKRVYSAYNSGNPDKYLTSAQVARNVNRAVEWLNLVMGVTGPGAGGAGALAVVLAAGLYYLWTR